MKAIAKLVTASVDDAFKDMFHQGPARLTVTLADGSKIEHVRHHASGSRRQPLTHAQLKSKFMSCARQAMAAEGAEALFARLDALSDHPSLDDLWPLLRVA